MQLENAVVRQDNLAPLNITVIGTGYVGLVTGACLAYIGHHVTCVDANPEKIQTLLNGGVPIYEPYLQELLLLAQAKGGISFSSNLADPVRGSDVIFIAVGTPSLPNGAADLQYLETAANEVGRSLDASRKRIVVNKSTVPIGSGNLVGTLIREGARHQSEIQFAVASNPEFLREGSAIADSLYPDRIVIGADDADARQVMERLYRPIIDQTFASPSFLPRPAAQNRVPLVNTTLPSAEMIKYASNAFLATKISFANEVANICDRVGAGVSDVMSGIGLDSRIGSKFLNAGIGWGGSCFAKDLNSLLHTAAEYGYKCSLLEAAQTVNRHQRLLVITKLQEKLLILKGRTIGLLGLAFKPETDDLRDAPSLTIATRLHQMGARVRVYDPVAAQRCMREHPDLPVQYCDSVEMLAERADALVLVTEWSEFRNLDLHDLARRMARAVIVDGRNALDAEAVREAGFEYCGIGVGALPPKRHYESTLQTIAG